MGNGTEIWNISASLCCLPPKVQPRRRFGAASITINHHCLRWRHVRRTNATKYDEPATKHDDVAPTTKPNDALTTTDTIAITARYDDVVAITARYDDVVAIITRHDVIAITLAE